MAQAYKVHMHIHIIFTFVCNDVCMYWYIGHTNAVTAWRPSLHYRLSIVNEVVNIVTYYM